jgi:RNA polymerase sigma factor (sigma-70 family)
MYLDVPFWHSPHTAQSTGQPRIDGRDGGGAHSVWGAMDKGEFVRACQEGGPRIESALKALYRDYGGPLLREAWLCLRDTEAARDLLQDTLLKAWRRCEGFRAESELFPWLKQVLRHGAIDRLRAQPDQVSVDDGAGALWPAVEAALRDSRPGEWQEPERLAQQRQCDEVYRRCAARFAADHPQAAQLIRWVVEDELTPADVAQLLQRSPGATREYISQCRKKARLYFADWYRLVAQAPSADDQAARERAA